MRAITMLAKAILIALVVAATFRYRPVYAPIMIPAAYYAGTLAAYLAGCCLILTICLFRRAHFVPVLDILLYTCASTIIAALFLPAVNNLYDDDLGMILVYIVVAASGGIIAIAVHSHGDAT